MIVVKSPGALEQLYKVLLSPLLLQRVIENIRKELENILSSVEITISKSRPDVIMSGSTSETIYPVYTSILYIEQVYICIELSFDICLLLLELN